MAKEKNVLKCEKKVMITCDYNDFNNFMQEEFNIPNYEIIAEEELHNDMTWTATVESNEMDAKELLKIIRTGNAMWSTRKMLDHLCFEGKLEAGDYGIEICW
jgi:hypothetical protein